MCGGGRGRLNSLLLTSAPGRGPRGTQPKGVVGRWAMGVLNCLPRLVLLGAMNLVSIRQAGAETQSGDVGMVGAAWFSRFSSRTLLQEASQDVPAGQDPLAPLGLFLSPNCPPFIPGEAGVSTHFLSPLLNSKSPRAGSSDSALPASAQCVPVCLLPTGTHNRMQSGCRESKKNATAHVNLPTASYEVMSDDH